MTKWPRLPIRRVFRVVNGGTPSSDASNWDGEVPWATPVDLGRVDGGVLATTDRTLTEAGLLSGSRMVPAGSLVVSTRAPIGYVAEAGVQLAFNQGCRGLVPVGSADSRYFRYQLSVMESQLGSRGQGSTFVELSSDGLASSEVVCPPPAMQRAIANFLDAETARIDTLIAKKSRMLAVLEELRLQAFEIALSAAGVTLPDSVDPERLRNASLPSDWLAPKLSSVLLQLTNGYVGPTRDILRDEGIRYIQGLHIKRGRIDFDRRPYYVEEEWHSAHQRTALRPGDVLIVQTGDIGQVAVVPEGFGAANCHALLIARADPDLVSGMYLGIYLQSRFGYNSLIRVATGALHPHLEFGIRDVPVVVPPRSVQGEVVAAVLQRQQATDRAVAGLTRQINLLTERRRALITAAVTGELDIARTISEQAS